MSLSGLGPSAASDCSSRGLAVFTLSPELDAALIWGHGCLFIYFCLPLIQVKSILNRKYYICESVCNIYQSKCFGIVPCKVSRNNIKGVFYLHSISSQGGTSGASISFIGVSYNAWPITLSILKAARCD